MANVNLEIQATQLRDGLETLVGAARLDASAIKNLAGSYTDAEARAANIGLASTGNILLDRIGGRTYNEVTPATGNITIDTAGSVIGGMAVIEHNDSVAPSIIITPTNITRNVLNAYVPNVINEIWFLKKADKININYVQPTVVTADTTPPTFTSAPTAENIDDTSFDITATLNKNGIVYGYLLANDASAPTVDEVIANAQESFTDSGSGGTLSFTGLVVDTNYDVYVVAVDTEGNKQTSNVLVEVFTISAFIEPTRPPAEYLFKLDLTNTSTMFEERSIQPSGVPVTEVTTVNQAVGTIFEMSRACQFLQGANKPILGVDGLQFDGVNDFLEGRATSEYIRQLTKVEPIWSFRCKIKKSADNSLIRVMSTGTGSTAGHGVLVQITAANKLQIFAARGTSGVPMVNFFSTTNILVADGIVPIQININGTGTNDCNVRIGSVTETFTILQGANGLPNNFIIGGIGGGNSYQICESVDLINRVWTTSEMDAYESQTTTRNSVNFGLIKQWELDFSDATKNFADAAGNTQVTNGSVTRLTQSGLTIPADIDNAIVRNITAASDEAAPLWFADADGNGNAGIRFNGDGVKLMTYGENPWRELGGSSTSFFIFLQKDLAYGSHIRSNSAKYLVITGKNYQSSATYPAPYAVAHTDDVTGGTIPTAENGLDIIGERRKGGFGGLINRNGLINEETNWGALDSLSLGLSSQTPLWTLDGDVIYFEKYMGVMSNADVAKKLASLRLRFNIPKALV